MVILEMKNPKDDIAQIYIWRRDENGKLIHRVVEFEPHFYDERMLNNPLITRSEEEHLPGLRGEKLFKFYTRHSSDVPKVRTYSSHSADIYLKKIFYAKEVTEEMLRIHNSRIFVFDIETGKGSNAVGDAKSPILSIAVKDSFSKEGIVIVWREDLEHESVEHKIATNAADEQKLYIVKRYDNERDMLSFFLQLVSTFNPDDYSGWYIIGFDMPYVVERLKIHNFSKDEINTLARFGPVFNRDKKTNIQGRNMLDAYSFIKKVSFEKFADYQLNTVCRHLKLKNRKLELDKLPGELWKTDIDLLVEYNLFDVLSVEEILFEYGVYQKTKFLQIISHSELNDLLFPTFSSDNYLLYRCRNKIILPNRPKGDKKMKMKARGHGGATIEPTVGIHGDTACLDWASLYPFIIMMFRMSAENAYTDEDDLSKLKNPCRLNNGITFDLDAETAVLADEIEYIIEQQNEIKKERNKYDYGSDKYKEFQMFYDAYKAFRNSFFGIMKQPSFRLSSFNVFQSITYVGRELLLAVKKKAEENGAEVIYGDTDSVFLKHPKPLLIEEIINNSIAEFLEGICDNVPEVGVRKRYFRIQYEKHYSKIFFKGDDEGGAKKRYAGLLTMKNGKKADELDIVGFKRRDSSVKGLKMFEEVLEAILRTGKRSEADKVVLKYLKEVRELDMAALKHPREITDYLCSQALSQSLQEYRPRTNQIIRGCYFGAKNLNLEYDSGMVRYFAVPMISFKGHVLEKDAYISVSFEHTLQVPWDKIVINKNEIWKKAFASQLKFIYDTLGWEIVIKNLKVVTDAW